MAGGAADLDGRLQIGDEITHINTYSVVKAFHREVIGLMGEATAQGEVILGIRRKMPPVSESVPPPGSYGSPQHQSYQQEESNGPMSGLPRGPRDITVHRPDVLTNFGFTIKSNPLRAGYMISKYNCS